MPISLANIRSSLINLRDRSSFKTIESTVDTSIRNWLLLNLSKLGKQVDDSGSIRSLTQEIDDADGLSFGEGITIIDDVFDEEYIQNLDDYTFTDDETLTLDTLGSGNWYTLDNPGSTAASPTQGVVCTGLQGSAFTIVNTSVTKSQRCNFLGNEENGAFLNTFICSGTLEDLALSLDRAGKLETLPISWTENAINTIVSSYSEFSTDSAI